MRIEENFARQQALFNTRFNSEDNTTQTTNEKTFGNALKKAIDGTNEKLVESDSATNSFIRGDDINIDEVMVKNQEASLCLQFLTQTRDKLLEGYETLSKLQL
ncbi:flagellar hook-basal body complex protein FliE [Clostridium butyricum]|uniref:Flagellar hook-basal body complex protein FliE n=1 Tax=Clostridium butyricum E4 str. BoNT E BL5262 TaxID=632245 RepID=C4IDL3_CLOBU|nr:flagellar hook-basal body complex protein FliE [Clostridium butyricum]APF22460.1 flagellar hook-basal body complex protein FliE [Clostridium butyricum]EDT75317.1 flagellar hook-basal body complex protein [Clostridium butyricum 5521]EEP55626.1 flagellar hook-basal body complex protein FliE [Clostridium butyricum E4 str. BoNT E BL5262]NFL31300.1 flagellar hook-basal body complex protein FliE [Clostridium butyricum]NFS18209.1 flagellar hook-basal body complex protein FliE [Clostridium butyricu